MVVSIENSGRTLRTQIADTGQGVPAELEPHLFTAYTQASKWRFGTGLGLYHVHELAAALEDDEELGDIDENLPRVLRSTTQRYEAAGRPNHVPLRYLVEGIEHLDDGPPPAPPGELIEHGEARPRDDEGRPAAS